MSRKYFGTDGIRGTVGQAPITPDFVLRLAHAVGRVLKQTEARPTVLIGKDTRISGYMLESALESGFNSAGVDVVLLGPLPTPGVAYLTRAQRASLGVVISASHNPFADNGIKFFGAQGSKLSDAWERDVEAALNEAPVWADSADLGKTRRLDDAAGRYIEFCKASVPTRLDFSDMRIIVDCAHGATYHIAPHVFSEVGAEVVAIGAEPDGLNINDECGATKPDKLAAAVLAYRADLGIALDGDGDRLIMVDHKGEIVDGDELIYIIAKSRLEAGMMSGPVVGTLMTNLGMEHGLKKLGINLIRAKVGDRYVMEMLNDYKGILGGENSGHIICLDRTTTGDGIIAALQIMAEMQSSGKSLHELKSGMHKYPQVLINIKTDKKVNLDTDENIKKSVSSIEKKLGDTGRVLLRASGTEPLIRVMVEGQNEETVKNYAQQLTDDVKKAIGA
jgi:phosphoglucosamine mutase